MGEGHHVHRPQAYTSERTAQSALPTHPYHNGLTEIKQLKKDANSGDGQSQSTIYQLTQAMVGEESYKISPAICTQVAIMVHCRVSESQLCLTSLQRQVHLDSPDIDFWDQVDKALDSIKTMSEDTRFRCVTAPRFNSGRSLHFPPSYLKAILSRNCRTYGVVPGTIAAAPSDNTATGDEPLIQQRIENSIEAPGGSVTF